MSKRYGVNITRTITVEQTVYVMASNASGAREKVQRHYDDGKGGEAYIEFRHAKGLALNVETDNQTESFETGDAWEDE
jgi:hypothetical protein